MLIPRFSLRWILISMTALSVFFLVVSMAFRESVWAVAIVVAAAALVGLVLVHGLAFLGVWLVTQVFGFARPGSVPASPFASSAPPVQILPPQDPVE